MRILWLLMLAAPLWAQRQLDLDSFEKVWTTVRDKHWQAKPAGLDWEAVHAEFRPRAEKAATTEEMRALMREMLGRLKQTHFGIIPGSTYALLAEGAAGEGVTGIDLRVLDGAAVVVRVDPGSSAEKAGVKPATIAELKAGRAPKSARKDERAIFDFVQELYKTRRVSDRNYKRVHALFADSGMVEFVGILGYYGLVAMTLDVFRVPLPEGAALPFAEPK